MLTQPSPEQCRGKTFLVTGANSGIGRVAAVALAQAGAHVVLANRSREKSEPVLEEIARGPGSASFLALDLSDLAQVQQAGAAFAAQAGPLHGLINNAGLAGHKGLTPDGFEWTVGVNHLGHFVFTHHLLPKLQATPGARVVHVASRAHYRAAPLDFKAFRLPTASATGFSEYATSKLCNVLFSAELAKRLKSSGVLSVCLHPGVVATDVWRSLPKPLAWVAKRFMLTEEEGAATTLFCATDPSVGLEQSGLYYERCAPVRASHAARQPELAQQLWEWSQEAAKAFLPESARLWA